MNVYLHYMPKKIEIYQNWIYRNGMQQDTDRDTDIFFSVGKTEQSWVFCLGSLIHICFLSPNWHIINVIQRLMNIIHCGQGLIMLFLKKKQMTF